MGVASKDWAFEVCRVTIFFFGINGLDMEDLDVWPTSKERTTRIETETNFLSSFVFWNIAWMWADIWCTQKEGKVPAIEHQGLTTSYGRQKRRQHPGIVHIDCRLILHMIVTTAVQWYIYREIMDTVKRHGYQWNFLFFLAPDLYLSTSLANPWNL